MRTIVLLVVSNLFMTYAWYGHLKIKGDAKPLLLIILTSWLIALPEYGLAVPANRMGHVAHGGTFTAPQLKVLQEGISLLVFLGFSILVLRETPTWRDLVGMGLIFAGLIVALSNGAK